MSSAARTEARMLAVSIAGSSARPVRINEPVFEVYRVRSLDWFDAKPELLATCDTLGEAMMRGQDATQPKAFFYVRREHGPRRIMVDSYYTVRTTSKHTIARQAYDGPYIVREKGRVAEHLFDVAAPAGAAL